MGLDQRRSQLPRPVQEIRQVGVPRPRQRRQDHSPAHAQGRQAGAACAHSASDKRGALFGQHSIHHI